MLKSIFLLVVSILYTFCLTTPMSAGEIKAEFRAKLLVMPPDSQITALVFIKDKIDLASLVAQLDAANADRATRHRIVIEALRGKANAIQAQFLNYLSSQKEAGELTEYKAFWIDNVILVRGKARALLAAENIPGVSTLYEIEENVRVELRASSIPETVSMQSFGCINPGTARPNLKHVKADSLWARGLHGEGRLICVFDSGVNLHDAFASRWRGMITQDPFSAWFDPFTGSITPYDTHGNNHGTRVTSIAVGIDSPDTVGVAWGAQWIAALVTPDGGGTPTSNAGKIISAYQWAIDPDGNPGTMDDVPDVINNSWGQFETCSTIFYSAIDNVEAAGNVNIIAVANDGDDPGSVKSPESRIDTEFKNFGVGNLDTHVTPFVIRSSSGRGPSPCAGSGNVKIKPEVVAPGSVVCSAIGTSGYDPDVGASFATPHVSGTIAVLRQIRPNTTTPDSLKSALINTTEDFGDPGNDNDYGYGLIDALAAAK